MHWTRDAKNYQFWNDGNEDGRFTITQARPGRYTLHAFADGVLGEFARTDLVVAPSRPSIAGETASGLHTAGSEQTSGSRRTGKQTKSRSTDLQPMSAHSRSWHPFPEVHWEEPYFRAVARRCDQLAVMRHNAGHKIPKSYQKLMPDWTVEVLAWSEG